MAIDDSLERARLHPDVLKNLNKNKKLKTAEAYSEDNPPPYPVTKVNNKTGDVSLGKSDVGLGSVANERQYSADNPPPYPVTSVNGQTGEVDIPTVDLPVSVQDGGTGADNAADARTNLGLGSVATENVVPLNKGGTGASNAADARTNLAVLPLAGGTVTGQVKSTYANPDGFLVEHGAAGKDACFRATRSDTGVSVMMGVGSGGINHGVYSTKLGKWLIYGDGSNVYCNGTATNVTGTVAIDHGGTGATTAAAARTNLGVPSKTSQLTNDSKFTTLLAVYPVGSIYMSVNSTSPATLFGGTWERLQDRFLLAAGSTYAAGSTGGASAVTLTTEQIPSHSHSISPAIGWPVNANAAEHHVENWGHSGWPKVPKITSTGNAGGGQAHNNMPPYLAVYMWKRTK